MKASPSSLFAAIAAIAAFDALLEKAQQLVVVIPAHLFNTHCQIFLIIPPLC